MNNNYDFAAARLNFIARHDNISIRILIILIKNESLTNRIKAFYMLLAPVPNKRSK
jgi:hypothetical protein